MKIKEEKMEKLIRFFKDEEGASMVEYALLVALIAVIVMAALGPLGSAISSMFVTVEGKLP
jgi:pilus assembly protein Flp/PilA